MYKFFAIIIISLISSNVYFYMNGKINDEKIKNSTLTCKISTISNDNTILKNNIDKYSKLREVELAQQQKILRLNNEIIEKQKSFNSDVTNINNITSRLLIAQKEARNTATKNSNINTASTKAIYRYATLQEKLYADCRTTLIEVGTDASKLQEKLKEFDKKWDIQKDSIQLLIEKTK